MAAAPGIRYFCAQAAHSATARSAIAASISTYDGGPDDRSWRCAPHGNARDNEYSLATGIAANWAISIPGVRHAGFDWCHRNERAVYWRDLNTRRVHREQGQFQVVVGPDMICRRPGWTFRRTRPGNYRCAQERDFGAAQSKYMILSALDATAVSSAGVAFYPRPICSASW